jgi:protein involved in polysaccharide export with SLBB domain
VGVIEAAGNNLDALNKLVNESAKKWFEHPNIVIKLDHRRPTQVYLLGAVSRPGLYLQPPAAAAESSSVGPSKEHLFVISEALQMAGGLKEDADIRHIHITRQHPKQVIDVDLGKLMLDGDVTEDLVLQPGDVVFVPKGGSEFNSTEFGRLAPKVRVLGAVKNPGLFVMSSDDDLVSVLARAGGFTPTAKTKNITVARTNRDGTVTSEKINVKDAIKGGTAMARIRVHPGDVVTVQNEAMMLYSPADGRGFSRLPSPLLAPNVPVGDFGPYPRKAGEMTGRGVPQIWGNH